MHNHLNEAEALERVLAGVSTADCEECAQVVGDVAIVAGVLATTAQHVPLDVDRRVRAAVRNFRPEATRTHFPWAAAAAVLVVGVATYLAVTMEGAKPVPRSRATEIVEESPRPLLSAPVVMGPNPEPIESRAITMAPAVPTPPPPAPPRDARDLTGDGVVDAADARLMIEAVVAGDGRWSAGDAHALMRGIVEKGGTQ